jgi:hypothetical protein
VDSEKTGEIRSVRPVFIEVLAVSGGEADSRSKEPERRDLTGDSLYACLMRSPDSAIWGSISSSEVAGVLGRSSTGNWFATMASVGVRRERWR